MHDHNQFVPAAAGLLKSPAADCIFFYNYSYNFSDSWSGQSTEQECTVAIGFLKFYKEGLLYAAHIGLNILNMLLSFAIVVLSTRPSELVDELERKGFSQRFGYIINSVFQIIPQMMGTMHTITDAQRSRGMETEGNLLVRIKAFLPLISPVVMSALTATRERAIALEVRGFGVKGTKTWMHPHKKQKQTGFFSWLCIISLILAVIGRVYLWLS